MTTPEAQVRRATIEDLPKLIPLWRQENLSWVELEKRFKEFQVAEQPGGELLGALGFQILGREALLHSECFTHAEQADSLRVKLWERAQIIAKNHGLVRVWTQLATPFWTENGFRVADAELLAKLPGGFGASPHPWRFTQLKEETPAAAISIDKEFALFREAEQEQTQKVLRQAKVLKLIAIAVTLAVVGMLVVGVVAYLKAKSRALR